MPVDLDTGIGGRHHLSEHLLPRRHIAANP